MLDLKLAIHSKILILTVHVKHLLSKLWLFILDKSHCVKSDRIRSFSGLYFLVFGLNTEKLSISLRIQSEIGKIRTTKTPNTDSFHTMTLFQI